jgi:hypothetical protein
MSKRRTVQAYVLVGLVAAGLIAVCILASGIPDTVRAILVVGVGASAVIAFRVVAIRASGGEVPWVSDETAEKLGDWFGEPVTDGAPSPCWRCGHLNTGEAERCASCGASLSQG